MDSEASTHRGIELLRVSALRARPVETLSHVAASLLDAAARRRFDLLHLHAEAPGLFAPLLARVGVPFVATIQGLDWQRAKWRGAGSGVLRRAEAQLARYATEIIVVSAELQRHFLRTYDRATHLIPNGVDEPGRVPHPERHLRRWALRPERYVVYVGRLVPEKRIEDLLRAYRSIDSRHRLVVVGEGGYSGDYVAHLRALAAADERVVFTGAQRGEALHALVQNAAAYVLPSELEGLPMSLLECLVQGTPAVVSDIPPHRELLAATPGYDLFFPAGDVDALRDRLSRLLLEPASYREIAASARRRVRDDHAWDAVAAATEAVFRRAVQSDAGAPSAPASVAG